MYDGRDANDGHLCRIVESLLQFSQPRRNFSCQNWNKSSHNTKWKMKWCFGWYKWWATMRTIQYSITYKTNEWCGRKSYILQFLLSLIRQSFSANCSMHEMNTHPQKRNALNVNTFQNYLRVALRITSLFKTLHTAEGLFKLEIRILLQITKILFSY